MHAPLCNYSASVTYVLVDMWRHKLVVVVVVEVVLLLLLLLLPLIIIIIITTIRNMYVNRRCNLRRHM